MTKLSFLPRSTVAIAVAMAVALLSFPVFAQAPDLDRRATAVLLAKDGIQVVLPPPDPSYCFPAGGPGSQPPNSVGGLVTINGAAAPAGTIVQLTFDGKAGTADAVGGGGGYRVDYHVDLDAACSNSAGAAIGVLVNGQLLATTAVAGSDAATPFFRFDVALTE